MLPLLRCYTLMEGQGYARMQLHAVWDIQGHLGEGGALKLNSLQFSVPPLGSGTDLTEGAVWGGACRDG